MESALFVRFVRSSLCPHGTSVVLQNTAGQNVAMGETDQATGLVGGLTLLELAKLTEFSKRELLARLHISINELRMGMSAWMVRSLATRRAYIEFVNDFQVTAIPKYLNRMWHAWQQNYKDLASVNRGIGFYKAHESYNWFWPDNYIYNLDHMTPRFMGGGDEISNLQAISLTSHYKKTMREIRQAAKLRKKKRRLAVRRRNNRYNLRQMRVVNYRRFLALH